MILFQKLPSIILKKILRYCVDSPGTRKQKLVCLSVCHEWRELAKPAFYRFAYVSENAKRTSPTDHSWEADAAVDAVEWTSDIDLVSSAGAVLSVRKLFVEIKSVDGLYDFVNILSPIFALDGSRWTGVKSFELRIPTDLEQQFRQTDDFQRLYRHFRDDTVSALCRNLGKGVPNVRKLDLTSGYEDCCASYLSSRLVEIYSARLRWLTGVSAINFSSVRIFPHITTLDIMLDSSATLILPLINAQTLNMLRLQGLTRRFSWSYFDYKKGSKHLCFPRLSGLFLSFVNDDLYVDDVRHNDANSNGPSSASFPNLKSLIVLDYPQKYSLFNDCVFPKAMDAVLLADALQVLQSIEFSPESSIDDISVTLANDAIDNQSCQVLNRLFGQSMENQQCRLSVQRQFEPNNDLIFWPNLKELNLQAAYFADLIVLLPKLPVLEYIYVNEVSFDMISTSDARFDPVHFIQTQAESLLDYSQVSGIELIHFLNIETGLAIECIKVLLKCLKSLTRFAVPEDVAKTLESFIEENKQEYPHFDTLRIFDYF